MFKVVVLQTLYTLSDEATQFQIRDRAGELMEWIATTIIPARKEHVPRCLIETFRD